MKTGRNLLVVVGLALIAGACSSGGDSVQVEDPWGRPSPSSASNAAFYMQISGGGEDDVLASAESPKCSVVELHETTMSDGVMSMEHLPQGIPIPAGETVSLEPGGLHVMCMGVEEALVEGENIDVQLQFEKAGLVTVSAEIREG